MALTLRIKGDAPRVAWASVNFPYLIECTNGQRYTGMTDFLLSKNHTLLQPPPIVNIY